MNIKDKIRVNHAAKSPVERKAAIDWFHQMDSSEKSDVLRFLANVCLQAHPLQHEVDSGIEESGLKSTYTPCALLKKGALGEQMAKVVDLPEEEWEKAFVLLMSVFSVADSRRQMQDCSKGCDHWWHQDLDDDAVVDSIVSKYHEGRL